MAITRADVLHVAALAQLELGEDEIARLTEQLNDILAAVGKVSELDLSDVPPTSHPLAVVNAFRPDAPRPSLPPSRGGRDPSSGVAPARRTRREKSCSMPRNPALFAHIRLVVA